MTAIAYQLCIDYIHWAAYYFNEFATALLFKGLPVTEINHSIQ